MRAKVTGSNNPLNTVRATFKGLTSQVRDQLEGFSLSYLFVGLAYSGTSDKGPSEIGTTSLQGTLVAAPC